MFYFPLVAFISIVAKAFGVLTISWLAVGGWLAGWLIGELIAIRMGFH
jgi:hypothetical protein